MKLLIFFSVFVLLSALVLASMLWILVATGNKDTDVVLTFDEFMKDFENAPQLYSYDESSYKIMFDYSYRDLVYGYRMKSVTIGFATLAEYLKALVMVLKYQSKKEKEEEVENQNKAYEEYRNAIGEYE